MYEIIDIPRVEKANLLQSVISILLSLSRHLICKYQCHNYLLMSSMGTLLYAATGCKKRRSLFMPKLNSIPKAPAVITKL